MLNKRTNILFEDSLWNKLTKLAQTNNTSVGNLVREAVKEKYLSEEVLNKRRQAINATLKNRIISKSKINYKQLINYGRKY